MSDSDLCDNEVSDFENDENRSVEKIVEIMKTLKPYQFEPVEEVSETDTNESDTESFEEERSYDENTARAGCLNWCLCLKCKVEEREIDCLCFQELATLNEKLDVEKNATCITEAEEFKTLCLNNVVLQNVLVGFHDTRGDYLEEKTPSGSYRFASYKQFTWWVYKSLRNGNRRVIPSCVLWSIRNLFPEPDNKYVLYAEGKKD